MIKKPNVWRFVGFASSVIGLFCYALSSSFDNLFGDWNRLKFFLYIVFSFFIIIMTLFAKTWQHSIIIRFKAQTRFLVLTTTSLYSFFFDKVMNGKPDTYSLLSVAAFAIMLLSLSRQAECGFVDDLLYFSLGSLIVLLMKIKPLLFIFGAGFSCIICFVYSSFSSIDNERPTIFQDENSVIIEVSSHSSQLNSTDIGSSMMEELSNHVMSLRQENSNIIEMLIDDSGFNMSDPEFMIKALPTETIDALHKTAKLMVSTGSEKVFCDIYSSFRRECLVESLSRLRFKKVSIEDIQMLSWKEMEEEIERWIKASNVALKILFPTERRLCDRVFFGFSSAANLSFMDVCRESTLQLLNFTEVLAIGSQSPERLFRVIDMFETMHDLIPEFESLFRDQYSVSLLIEATTSWKRLGETIRGIFMELENEIRSDPAKVADPDCGLHPITNYVMNYLCAVCRSHQTLEQVFEDYGHPLNKYPKIEARISSSSSLSVQMGRIMELLESNLETKSKLYKTPLLCYNFLLNNFSYILQKVQHSELGVLLGDDWIKKYSAKIWNYQTHKLQICIPYMELDPRQLNHCLWKMLSEDEIFCNLWEKS